jgi:hypothetical protein
MKVYQIFKNGKIETMEAVSFLEMKNKKVIPLRLFIDGEIHWTSPHFEKFSEVATRLKRNEKINQLFS